MDYYQIGQRIRRARKARRLSQEELAEQVGISVSHMSHIETGNTKLSLPVLAALATVLETSADALLWEPRPASRTEAEDRILQSLEGCTTAQLRVLGDILETARASIERNF